VRNRARPARATPAYYENASLQIWEGATEILLTINTTTLMAASTFLPRRLEPDAQRADFE